MFGIEAPSGEGFGGAAGVGQGLGWLPVFQVKCFQKGLLGLFSSDLSDLKLLFPI